ncbi:MAG TPA: hypothetical protein VFH48_36510 [Chloroflexota bacterium]|nr:hypothetical protein [Chloroflexota bacterium]
MALRFAKLPIVACACLIAGVVIGLVLAPANAQQLSGIDGQVAVRSDYAVYLITDGQRRWIATVLITDEEINAYPEAEPIFSGVTPLPPQVAAAPPAAPPSPPPAAPPVPPAPPAAPPAGAAPPLPGAIPPPAPGAVPPVPGAVPPAPGAVPPAAGAVPPAPAPVPGAVAPPAAAPPPASGPPPGGYPTPVGATGNIDPQLPIEVDIDGKAEFEHGNEITVVVKSIVGASCELTVRWPDATEAPQPPQIADARGRCSFTTRVPSTVPIGLGFMKGSVRSGGRTSDQTVEFQIVSDV